MSRSAFPSVGMHLTILPRLVLPVLLAGAAALLSPSPASAQSKIGIINFQRAVLATADMKKASMDLAAKYKPKQDQLAKAQQEMAEIQDRLRDPKTPAAQAQDLQLEGQRRQREAQRITEDLRGEAEKDRNEILQGAAVRMTDVVKKLADEKNLDMVVDVANAVFFKPALEITEEAIAAYDRTYPVK